MKITIPIKEDTPSVRWSPYQEDIFSAVSNSTANLLVQAVAGSGKTTTIVECMKQADPSKRCGFVAFNKAIAMELSDKVPPQVTTKTFHAIGYQALTLEGYKTWKTKTRIILDDICKERGIDTDTFYEILGPCRKVIGMLKANILQEDVTMLDVLEIASETGYPISSEMGRIILDVWNLNNKGKYAKVMDFDDMLRQTVLNESVIPEFDLLFVDEAQDLNRIQHKLVEMMVAKNGRIIAVGDRHQAIYGFRGASSSSMDDMSLWFSMKEMPLSVSYRCATSIITEAQKFNTGIYARDGAPQGRVLPISPSTLYRYKFEEDEEHMILGRFNYSLFQTALRMRLYSQPTYLRGKDIVPSVISVAKMIRKELGNITSDRVVAFAKRRETKRGAEAIIDNCNIILLCIEEGCTSIKMIGELLYEMFPKVEPKGFHITLSTIHKSKGLESDNVYLLDTDKMPGDMDDEMNVGQEGNLMYVAITRAKERLYYVK